MKQEGLIQFFIKKYDKTYVMIYLNNFYSMYHIFSFDFDVINKKLQLHIDSIQDTEQLGEYYLGVDRVGVQIFIFLF